MFRDVSIIIFPFFVPANNQFLASFFLVDVTCMASLNPFAY
jgi:hypothetical protein